MAEVYPFSEATRKQLIIPRCNHSITIESILKDARCFIRNNDDSVLGGLFCFVRRAAAMPDDDHEKGISRCDEAQR